MMPALRPGRLVVAIPYFKALRPGDIVIIRHAGMEKIKRIRAIREDSLYIVGDNPAHSTDSRSFGWLPNTAVAAKVMWPRT